MCVLKKRKQIYKEIIQNSLYIYKILTHRLGVGVSTFFLTDQKLPLNSTALVQWVVSLGSCWPYFYFSLTNGHWDRHHGLCWFAFKTSLSDIWQIRHTLANLHLFANTSRVRDLVTSSFPFYPFKSLGRWFLGTKIKIL